VILGLTYPTPSFSCLTLRRLRMIAVHFVFLHLSIWFEIVNVDGDTSITWFLLLVVGKNVVFLRWLQLMSFEPDVEKLSRSCLRYVPSFSTCYS
jgi:hypothetical protein